MLRLAVIVSGLVAALGAASVLSGPAQQPAPAPLPCDTLASPVPPAAVPLIPPSRVSVWT
jgi:hypothetical protein